jgi:nucleoid-associated protein YgaU
MTQDYRNTKEKIMAEEKKGLFGKLFGKKESAEEIAQKAKAELEKQRADMEARAAAAKKAAEEKAKEVAEAAKKEADELARKAEEVANQNRERVEQAEKYKQEAEARKAEFEAKQKEAEEAARNAVIATHTVSSNETLSHIALRYYGHATPAYYTLIYEKNKDVIGPNMNIIVPGQVLQIPALPEELK